MNNRIELPCCGSKTTLQVKSGTGPTKDSTSYWLRTCPKIMCQRKWHINKTDNGFEAREDKPAPELFSL